jgi:hypothetical protein
MYGNVFNNQGQLNASNLQDAFTQLAKFASILEENAPSNLALAGQPSMANEKRDSLVEKAIMSQEGKVALAQAMANPIR